MCVKQENGRLTLITPPGPRSFCWAAPLFVPVLQELMSFFPRVSCACRIPHCIPEGGDCRSGGGRREPFGGVEGPWLAQTLTNSRSADDFVLWQCNPFKHGQSPGLSDRSKPGGFIFYTAHLWLAALKGVMFVKVWNISWCQRPRQTEVEEEHHHSLQFPPEVHPELNSVFPRVVELRRRPNSRIVSFAPICFLFLSMWTWLDVHFLLLFECWFRHTLVSTVYFFPWCCTEFFIIPLFDLLVLFHLCIFNYLVSLP